MKLLRELDLESIPRFCFGRQLAADLVDVRRKYIANEIDEGHLRIFHPVPEFLQIHFKDLVEWYEEFGDLIPANARRELNLFYRRTSVPRTEAGRRQRKQHFAGACVFYAMKAGLFPRGNCEFCGAPDALAHHENYDWPLKITWFCQTHHVFHHTRQWNAETEMARTGRSAQLDLWPKCHVQELGIYNYLTGKGGRRYNQKELTR